MAGKKITKAELITRVAKKSGESRKMVAETFDAFFAEVRKRLKKRKSIWFAEKDHNSDRRVGLEFKLDNKKTLVVRLHKA